MASSTWPNGARAYVQTSSISATGAREAEEALNRVYGNKLLLNTLDKTKRTNLKFSGALLKDVLIGQFTSTNLALQRQAEKDTVTILSHVRGRTKFSVDSPQYELRDSGAVVLRPNIRATLACPNGSINSLVIPRMLIRNHAENLVGNSLPDLFGEIKAILPSESRLCGELRKQMKFTLYSVFGLDSIGSGALAATGNRELLLSFAAACLFPMVGRQFGEDAPDCGHYVVRRAREYIKAHATEPVNLAELARDLGVSMRSLQLKFKKCFGLSPRDYLMDCRLDIAHGLLSSEGLCPSVTHAAMAAGFSDLSHFSIKYRERFGQPPSDALRSVNRT